MLSDWLPDDLETTTKYDFPEVPEGGTFGKTSLSYRGTVIYIEEENDLLVKIQYCPTDGTGALFLLPEKAIKRLSNQRNYYAYGDLDIGFIDLSLLDVIYLERIVYSMQLKYYGVKTRSIQ